MTHLGRRVSDLLDGQLSAAETDAAWDHVHTCPTCRDEVEREGWVKTQLASLSWDGPGHTPDRLKGALLGLPPADCYLGGHPGHDDLANFSAARRHRLSGRGFAGFAALGGGAAGAAVMGVLALGPAPAADLPMPERRHQPVTHPAPAPVPPRVPVRLSR